MNPIPKRVTVKGQLWKVRFKKGPLLHPEDKDECYAYPDFKAFVIYLDKTMPLEEQWRWFWHEFFHLGLHHLHAVAPADGGLNLTQEGVVCDGFADIMMCTFEPPALKKRRKR